MLLLIDYDCTLQSTGEANTEAMRSVGGDEMDDFISAPKVRLCE